MNRVLYIYSSKAYKAYLLPTVSDSDYSIIINKDIFELANEVELKMEVTDGKWSFTKSSAYELYETSNKDKEVKPRFEEQILTNGDVILVSLPDGEKISIIYNEMDATFGVFEKYFLEGVNEITFGSEEKNDIRFQNNKLISREHGVIRGQGNQWVVEDKSTNGVFVNARRALGTRQLFFGDVISAFGLTIVFLGNFIAVNTNTAQITINTAKLKAVAPQKVDENAVHTKNNKAKTVFHRSPRQIFKIETEPIEIEAPPQPKQDANKKPLGMIIGPSMTMAIPMLLGCGLAIFSSMSSGGSSSAFMFTGLITAISSALIGTIWALVNISFEKKRNRQDELHRFEAYSEYLINSSNKIRDKYEKNHNAMCTMYHSAEECCEYGMQNYELWNRNVTHSDFMTYRLGLGDIPFQVPINIPREKFTLINDSLSEKPAMIKESFKDLHSVPICIDFSEHRMIGIVGTDDKKSTVEVMHSLVSQIVTSNCYTDVKLAFVFDEKEEDINNWQYLRWLPHTWSSDKRSRFYATNKIQAGDVFYEIANILRSRAESRGSYSSLNKKLPVPQIILFVSNPSLLEGELISKYLTDEANTDITTVLLADSFEDLPNECTFIIQNDSSFKGMFSTYGDNDSKLPISFDRISNEQLEKLARTLSDIEVSELETGGDIPNALTFFDMYGINALPELNVMDKWKKNRTYDSMKAIIGQRAGGAPWYLDIHEKYHGPHGLVAGTTGSGKSETLQTYILSLAINYSPDDVGFFIIDYKGGGMANLFNGLPHLIGQISNLSGNQVKRAMVSIKSENKRRQRIFNEHGVNNINLYTRLYKNNEASIPVPHLFIIIDEFAELKREEPEFMRELISVAQVGRSLGVHLILATQKPSGTVDDNIWSNSKFRLCLRVQDRQDSTDMLHRPDAAYITQAGRCYMQVGNDELFELFQSGYSGATYDEESGSVKVDIAKMLSENGKAALVGNRMKLKQKEQVKLHWIQTLCKYIGRTLSLKALKIDDVLTDSMSYDSFEQSLFASFDKDKIEYPFSEYNVQRIRDLIKILAALFTDGTLFVSEESADKIIAYATEKKIKLPEKKEKTQLDAVVDYLAQIADKNGYVHSQQLWLPLLPTYLPLADLADYSKEHYFNGSRWEEHTGEWNMEVPMGMYDDPVNQAQDTITLNLSENGHHAIVGTVVTGKSTFLQTFVYGLTTKYNPEEVNIYCLDYSAKMLSAFEKMPHVGGVICEEDDDKAAKFFDMIASIIEERKKLFKGGNYAQYVRAHGTTVPAIVICVDNYSNFKTKTNNIYESIIMQLSKEGVSYGIFLVMTAGGFSSAEIPMRLGENLRTVMCLEMADKFQYSDSLHIMHIDTMPESNVKGRGIARVGEAVLEFQTAICIDEPDDFKRSELIGTLAEKMTAAWNGKVAKPIPSIPENPEWDTFSQVDEVKEMLQGNRYIPVGYNSRNAAIFGIDLSRTYCYLIHGKARSGKTNFMKLVMNGAISQKNSITVIDYAGELTAICAANNIDVIDTDEKLYNFFVNLKPEFIDRNKRKKALIQEGKSDEELFTIMDSEFDKKFIFIANLKDFVLHVNKPTGTEPFKPFVENILDKGALHNVFWFACYNSADVGSVAGNSVFDLFTRAKTGIHFGGNVSAQRIFNFDYVPFTEQSKSMKAGIGLLPTSEEESVHKVIIPMVKG